MTAEFAGTVYLAGPVRGPGREAAIEMRRAPERALVGRGYAVFNPPGGWAGDFGIAKSEQAIQMANDELVRRCDHFAMILDSRWESAGTEHEVCLAVSYGKPIMIFPIGMSQGEALARFLRITQGTVARGDWEVGLWRHTNDDWHLDQTWVLQDKGELE